MRRLCLALLFALLIARPVSAQPATPCAPNSGVWSITTTTAVLWVCATNGLAWIPVGGAAAGATWGTITGVLATQTDLQNALDGKLGTSGNGANLTGLTKTQVGLGNVDNTSDANKPISSATQTALDGKQASGNYATGGGTATGTNTGDQTSVSGNAGTATTLQTPRTINGVSFNGSANITVTAAGSTLSDNVPTSKLNSGTGATSSTFWRGDATWSAPSGPSYVVTTADTTNATTSYANITGLVFNVLAATRYRISCVIPYDANATTTGIGIGWVGPASPTLTRGIMTGGLTTQTVGATTIAGNDTGATTTASPATTLNVAHLEGIWLNGSNAGTIQLRVKSEVAIANAIIVRTGAMCGYVVY